MFKFPRIIVGFLKTYRDPSMSPINFNSNSVSHLEHKKHVQTHENSMGGLHVDDLSGSNESHPL